MEQGRLYWPGADDDGFGYALTPYAMGQACSEARHARRVLRQVPHPPTGRPVQPPGAARPGKPSRVWRAWDESTARESAVGEKWTLRAKDSTIRGVLSARYEKLDNRQLLDALLSGSGGHGPRGEALQPHGGELPPAAHRPAHEPARLPWRPAHRRHPPLQQRGGAASRHRGRLHL